MSSCKPMRTFNIPPPNSNSLQSMEDRMNKAIQEAMHYKALYDDLVDDLRGKGIPRRPPTSGPPINLPRPLIDRLIVFCHPDKHNSSNVANELTAELLKIRGK
jgi:hypothetical protein